MARPRFYSILLLTIGVLLGCTAESVNAQKVGSPEWKREFERKRAEFKRKFEASRAQSARNSKSSKPAKQSYYANRTTPNRTTTNRKTTSYSTRSKFRTNTPNASQSKFNPATAPSPIASIKAFQKAARMATSSKSLMPYLSEMQRSNRAAAESWGSKSDTVKFYRNLLDSIVRFDDVRIKGGVAYVDVVRSAGGYNTGTFTLKGENNQWRMDAYKDKMKYNYMPPARK